MSQGYQRPSLVDDKILLVIAMYRNGLGGKEIAKRIFPEQNRDATNGQILKRLKETGVFEVGRKSPAWLGLTQAKQCAVSSSQNQMKAAFLLDQREWRRAEKEYEQAVYPDPPEWMSPKRRIIDSLRRRLRKLMRQPNGEHVKIRKVIGCTPEELRSKIEAQWQSGWDWNNYGRAWVIDHFHPCAAFDLENEEEIAKCFHWSNLKPLGYLENARKSDKLPYGTRARNAA